MTRAYQCALVVALLGAVLSAQPVSKKVKTIPPDVLAAIRADIPDFSQPCFGRTKHPTLANSVRFHEIKLDKNGTPALVIEGINSCICSPVGNCLFWIFQKRGPTYLRLLGPEDSIGYGVLPTQSHRYFDIDVTTHASAWDTDHTVFRFDGSAYGPAKCFEESYRGPNNSYLKRPRTSPQPCRTP
jgi:hypothetical protein